jgi:arginyl-tRNA synthetase
MRTNKIKISFFLLILFLRLPSRNLASIDHTGFGLVLGEDKKRFRSRDGGTVLLRDLLDGGVLRAREGLAKRNEDRKLRGEEVVRN